MPLPIPVSRTQSAHWTHSHCTSTPPTPYHQHHRDHSPATTTATKRASPPTHHHPLPSGCGITLPGEGSLRPETTQQRRPPADQSITRRQKRQATSLPVSHFLAALPGKRAFINSDSLRRLWVAMPFPSPGLGASLEEQ